jgi:hypothetical protein
LKAIYQTQILFPSNSGKFGPSFDDANEVVNSVMNNASASENESLVQINPRGSQPLTAPIQISLLLPMPKALRKRLNLPLEQLVLLPLDLLLLLVHASCSRGRCSTRRSTKPSTRRSYSPQILSMAASDSHKNYMVDSELREATIGHSI